MKASVISKSSFLYDADCGPCTKFKRVVDWFDKYNRLDFFSLTDAEDLGLLNAVPPFRRYRSFHLISGAGVKSGATAIPELIRMFPAGQIPYIFATSVPGKTAIGFVYSVFSRLHGKSACALKKPHR